MRILYFSRTYTTHDRRFLCRLAESPHEVWYLRLEDDGIVYERRPLPAEVRVAEWAAGKEPVSALGQLMQRKPHFERVLELVQPDLVHAGPVPTCGFLAAWTGFRPLLVVSWGSDLLVEGERSALSRWATQYALRNSDRLLCDSNAVRAKAEQTWNYDPTRILQFPWGIDLKEFTPARRSLRLQKVKGPEDAFVILSTRTWNPGYGIGVLLEAFRMARERNSRLRLVLLGDGPLAAQINSFVSEHGLETQVIRPGRIPQEQLPEYFRTADLYVSCTPSDGTSISLLEALATGLPAVVSDIEGNREWVQREENGWLAPAGNAELFAQCLLRAAEMDSAKRDEIAGRNRRKAELRADWDLNSNLLLKAYDQMAKCALAAKPQQTLLRKR